MLSKRLRTETQPFHRELESGLDLLDPTLTRERYRRVLAAFHGFYQPLETRIEAALAVDHAALLQGRRKADWLLRDLAALDHREKPLACEEIPRIDGVGAALGAAYVLEGSTLGGGVMSRHFQALLGVTPDSGGAFFASYGERIPHMWRAFVETLDRWGETNDGTPAVRAAQQTFASLDRWLRRAVPA